jgi:uncharacterized membrane protein
MAELVIIPCGSEDRAEAARRRLFELQREHVIQLDDAVVAVREADGAVRMNHLVSTRGGMPSSGAVWGLLVGVIFLNPVLGVPAGTEADAAPLEDVGIQPGFMDAAAAALGPGQAALCLMARRSEADRLLPALEDMGATVLRTRVDAAQERRLREAIG